MKIINLKLPSRKISQPKKINSLSKKKKRMKEDKGRIIINLKREKKITK